MIPSTALLDENIHLEPFTSQWSASISPGAPASYNIITDPLSKSLLLCASGTTDPKQAAYPGVLFCPGSGGKSIPRPMLPNTGNVALGYKFAISSALLPNLHVWETDSLFLKGGLKLNGSLQRHNLTGQIDVGNWTNTQYMAGAIEPDAELDVTVQYAITPSALSVVSYTCDGVTGTNAAMSAPQAATPSNWLSTVEGSDGAVNTQFQIGLLPSGLPVVIRLWDVFLAYW